MNDTTIQMICTAIITNTKLIQSLIDALPHEVRETVAATVNPTPAPVVVQAPAPVVEVAVVPVVPIQATPVLEAVTIPVPVVAEVAAVPVTPVVVAAPAVASPSSTKKAPFSDQKSMVEYVMRTYTKIGRERGVGIQKHLESINCLNINLVKPEHYDGLFTALEAL